MQTAAFEIDGDVIRALYARNARESLRKRAVDWRYGRPLLQRVFAASVP